MAQPESTDRSLRLALVLDAMGRSRAMADAPDGEFLAAFASAPPFVRGCALRVVLAGRLAGQGAGVAAPEILALWQGEERDLAKEVAALTDVDVLLYLSRLAANEARTGAPGASFWSGRLADAVSSFMNRDLVLPVRGESLIRPAPEPRMLSLIADVDWPPEHRRGRLLGAATLMYCRSLGPRAPSDFGEEVAALFAELGLNEVLTTDKEIYFDVVRLLMPLEGASSVELVRQRLRDPVLMNAEMAPSLEWLLGHAGRLGSKETASLHSEFVRLGSQHPSIRIRCLATQLALETGSSTEVLRKELKAALDRSDFSVYVAGLRALALRYRARPEVTAALLADGLAALLHSPAEEKVKADGVDALDDVAEGAAPSRMREFADALRQILPDAGPHGRAVAKIIRETEEALRRM